MNAQNQNQESMLKESIKHFLTSYHSGSSDFSSFESIFFRLIQTMLDPPLEITWFYSAVTFHAAKLSPQNNPSTRVLVAKDLLNLLISCSNLSSASKKIALLAPVVYELYSIVCDARKCEPSAKMEVGRLVENMVGYVMMSAGVYDYGNEDVECDNVVVCFEDLIRVWTTDRGGGSCNFMESLRIFFPLLTDGTWKGMNARCGIRELVGIVLCEVFFLRLYLGFSSAMCTEDYLQETRDQVVQTIKGFRNCYFLVNMDAPAMSVIGGQIQPATYDNFLKKSISQFLGDYPKSISSLPELVSVFHRLAWGLKDPPLEIMWFYGAVTFHSCKPSILPPPAKLLVAKDLLQVLNSCSCLCGVVKKVAVIAPVLYLLYHLELNFSAMDPSLREEIRIIVEGIASYISICCCQCLDEGDLGLDSLGVYMLDLIRVWTVDKIRDGNEINVLASFFPTLSDEFQKEVTVCLGYLAGVVMNETLLLRLCLKISPGINREDLQREMIKLAIQTIKGFRNFYFLDMLLKMLLEPSLPVAASMSSEDAVLLQKALYDAVILVDYSFYSGRWAQSSSVSHSKKLALIWVLAADHAIQFARARADEARAISYLTAFCESELVAELIKWVHSQGGMVDQNVRPEITTPRALIKWLLVLEDQGIRVFDQTMSMLRAKAVACISRVESEFDLNFIDVDHDLEMAEQSNNGLPGNLSLSAKWGAGQKRKETLNRVQGSRVKQVKHDLPGSPVGERFLPLCSDDRSRRGSLVIDISSDDDMQP